MHVNQKTKPVVFSSRREMIFVILAGFFITNAVVAELIGGKLIEVGLFGFNFTLSIGIIPWPVVFLTTDLMNEYYGKNGVRKLSLLTTALIGYAFIVLFFALNVTAAGFSPVQDKEFTLVFGQSMWIIVASMIAFILSQFIDVFIFWLLREKTGGKMIWLRSTGSTAISQLVDTFVVAGIAFYLPGKITFDVYVSLALTNYMFKLLIAIGLTPLIYIGHSAIDKYLGEKEAHKIIKASAEESLEHKVVE